ncbi:MAG: hypothetical protein ACOYL9_05825 [Ilumatobacteraceae bacterium]
MTDAIVGIHGCGVTGQSTGRVVRLRGLRLAWFDIAPGASERARRRYEGVSLDRADDLSATDVVVLASPVTHAEVARSFVAHGVDVVSLSDDIDDVRSLLDLHEFALERGARVVVGAALAPGLSGILTRHLADQLDLADEIHVATHGTAGPSCARQHHHALGNTALGWHDGQWLERPGGSGRELCWFPDPIGPADCYRAALPDPLLLRRAFPEVERISARVSATRRDRLTSRLPMLSPPHSQGGRGAVRVEVRGAGPGGERVTHVAGAVGRTADLAGTVAAMYAAACVERRLPEGVTVAGDERDVNAWLLSGIVGAGVTVQQYNGEARASSLT